MQARAWCDKVNAATKRHLHASPRELFATEQPRLLPLPSYVPDVYQLHARIVDTEGYVNVHRNRYSAPWRQIGRRLEVRELRDRIELYDGPRRIAVHDKVLDPIDARVTWPEHRPPRSEGIFARDAPSAEERELAAVGAEMVTYVALLRKRGRSLHALRKLVGMVRDYPREPLLAAIRIAAHYGLDDLERLESLVLRHIAGDFFPQLPETAAGEHGEDDDDKDDEEPGGEDPLKPEDDDDG